MGDRFSLQHGAASGCGWAGWTTGAPTASQLLMYKPQRNAAGEGLLHALCIFKASAVGRVGEACGSLARQANLSLSSFHAGSTSLGHIDRVRCRC